MEEGGAVCQAHSSARGPFSGCVGFVVAADAFPASLEAQPFDADLAGVHVAPPSMQICVAVLSTGPWTLGP